ncbi:hypothetical protein [Mycolicibacterium sp. XJ1819]
MTTNTFWRLDPADYGGPDAILDSAVLDLSEGRILRDLAPHHGIVVASWDSVDLVGRVHALGVVTHVDKARRTATVDWRRVRFALTPSAQGRQQWINRPCFRFEDTVAERYKLAMRFADKISDGTDTVDDLEPIWPTPHRNPRHELTSSPPLAPQRQVTTPTHRQTRCNRVTPRGEIIAVPTRGIFMGNRSYGSTWLVCELNFPRELKQPRKYEKLFFFDEAVALAAGHRPCFTCRRNRYRDYFSAVRSAYPTRIKNANDLDDLLASFRSQATRPRARIDSLPDGTFVAADDEMLLLWQGWSHRWKPTGYSDPVALTAFGADEATVLTPAPSVAALRHGYPVVVHPSVANLGEPGGI